MNIKTECGLIFLELNTEDALMVATAANAEAMKRYDLGVTAQRSKLLTLSDALETAVRLINANED